MIDLFLKLGGFQALILTVFLFKKKTNSKANLVLTFLVLSLGVSCILYSFNNLEFYLKFPHLIRVDWGIPLLFGPLIYLYTSLLIDRKQQNEKYYIHFLPYLLNLLILFPFFIKPAEEKIQILDYFTASITSGIDIYFFYSFFLRIAISVISLSYAFKSLKIIRVYRNKLLDEYSNTEKLMLEWLRILLYSFLIISIIFICVSIITYGDRYPQFDYNVYYFICIFILIYILSYKALGLPKTIGLSYIDEIANVNIKPKVYKKNLSKHAFRLKAHVHSEKPHLNGELTASELAKGLQMSRHQLSQVLNEQLGKNFYDFINEYRVEEFKSRIQLPENNHLTLLGVAFDSGFNSKTTFNTIFKKTTGLTPSDYKKTINK